MITEAQKIKFKEYLDTFFNIVNKEINGETVEKNKQLEIWAVNVSSRYSYAVQGIKKNMHLPKEHIEILKESLEKQGLTLDEFLKTKGRRSNIIKLLKEKQKNSNTQNNNDNKEDIISKSLENYSIEELKELRAQYDEDIVSLNQKHTQKYKKLYSLSDTKYEEIGKRLKIAKSSRRRINEVIENKIRETEKKLNIQLELPKEPEIIEIIEPQEIIELPEQPKIVIVPEEKVVEPTTKVRKQKNANEKITEIMRDDAEKTAELEKVKKELAEMKQAKQNEILKYQGDYERRLAERTEKLKAEYQIDFERKTAMFEIESNRKVREANEKLEQQKQAFETYKIDKEKELDRQRRIQANQDKQTKEKQQQMLVKLLCSNDDVSLETIKKCLETEKIPTEGLEKTLKELRIMIPGITRVLKNEEDAPAYSLRTDAIKQLEEYKKDIVSPRISHVFDGKIEFIVRADLHLNMTNSEDTLKTKLETYFNYSAAHGNIPIIDLGDLAETLAVIKHKDWKNFDKEAAKLSYKFYKNYAKAIASAPETKHYTLLGNHDEHPYLVGVDPIEILSEYSDNFEPLGVSRGSFRIGNDSIGVFHDKTWQNIVSFQEYSKDERDEIIYDYLCEEVEEIASDYIYSLIGHYHFGAHNIDKRFSVINNGLSGGLIFTAEVSDGHVDRMFVTELGHRNYQIEIYNRGNQYRK